MRKIAEIIKDQQLIHVEPSDLVRSVAQTMTEKNIGAVAVLEKDKLVGVFTERDLMTRVVAGNLDPDTTTLGKVMTRDIAVASPAEPISDCVQRMLNLGCRHLPVVEDGQLIGMISLRDLLQVDSQRNQAKANFLRDLVTYSPDYES